MGKSIIFEEKSKKVPKGVLKGYSAVARTLLYNRGFTDEREVEDLLKGNYEEGTHDPYLMLGMDVAVERIVKALKNDEKIAIFSDYDADGVPGAVVLREFLEKIGFSNIESYIPHRGIEGFGLNNTAIAELKDKGVTLLITVDCGIADIEEVSYAQSEGIDVIISDHHISPEEPPPAIAILNPKQPSCKYPFDELCGAGVVYKLVQALIAHEEVSFSIGQEKWLLDLVGIATLADMVPLVDENRIFARYGLLVLNKGRRLGLRELLSQAKVDYRTISEDDVSFTIAPRINAASRMSHPDIAFGLLFAKTRKEAMEQAAKLEEINKERKTLVARIAKEVKKKFADRKPGPVLVTGNPRWKPGILGLIANSLSDSFERPAFVWGREGESGSIKGSVRSDGIMNVVEIMKSLPEETFINYGGHAFSGGFSIELEKVHSLEGLLNDAARTTKETDEEELSSAKRYFDMSVKSEEIESGLFEEVLSLSPFGVGFEKPIFKIEDVEVVSVKEFGKDKNHLGIDFKGKNGKVFNAIGFFMTKDSFSLDIEPGKTITIYGALEKSFFRGRAEYRVRIEHLEEHI
ncbi:MAG: single-stranded-DNA-specific exonuclease RecJ [Candidatus Campbellbacteria bacterium]|nr:single-stranded-DNA-specific exonuclease RecJ [Candidatus Campbellbacteria bacterium]